jgi:type IV pilus assembly protein PilM
VDIGGQWIDLVLAREGLPLFSRVLSSEQEALTRAGIGARAELIQEIRRSLEFYRTQAGVAFTPERLILTGGGARSEGLAEYCQDELGLKTTEGCLGGLQSERQLDPALAVAAGLALRERIV